MKEQLTNLIYVCHSLFAALGPTFWDIADLVSTSQASTAQSSKALASTVLVSTAQMFYTHFENGQKMLISFLITLHLTITWLILTRSLDGFGRQLKH